MSTKTDEVLQTDLIHTVIPIHGTFAAEGAWWRPGSEFCAALDACLEADGLPARCWAHLDHPAKATYPTFKWSGLNTETDRRTDAAFLTAYLIALCWDERIRSIHLVCHSHAGNLLYYAMSNPYFDNTFILAKIHSVTFLGTPFLKSRKFGSNFVVPPERTPSQKASLLFAALSDTYRPKKRVHTLNSINTQSIYYAADEAFTLLRHARALREDPGFYGFDPTVSFRMVLSSIIPNFYRRAFSTTRVLRRSIHPRRQITPPHVLGMTIPLTENGIVAWLRSFLSVEVQSFKSAWRSHPSKPFVTVVALLSPFNVLICTTLLLFDYGILSPIYLAKRKVGRLIERAGLRGVANTILGDNFLFDTISEIGRVPVAVSGCTVVELETVPGPQTDLVLNFVTTSMAQFYKLDHGPLATRVDIASLLDRARNVFVDPQLLHCRYYDDLVVTHQIAAHIGREPAIESEKRNAKAIALNASPQTV